MRKKITDSLNFPRLRAKYRLANQDKRSKMLDELVDLTGPLTQSNRLPKNGGSS